MKPYLLSRNVFADVTRNMRLRFILIQSRSKNIAAWICSLFSLFFLVASPTTTWADTDQYYYNGNNQLIETVNNESGRIVTYSYDANGSVIAINSVAQNALTISGFTPARGAVGSPLTIYGAGFDLITSNNAVAINGTPTIVTASTATQLTTSIPTGATSGPISVSNTAESAASATNFIVTASDSHTGEPIITLTLHALTFTSREVGSTSATQSITVTNTGATDLHMSSPILIGASVSDFSISNNGCSLTLIANASCTINVSFTPSAPGVRSATLSILSDASNGAQLVTLTGNGNEPASALISPSSLTYSTQPTYVGGEVKTVTVTNTGNETLTVTNVTITGANASDFMVLTNWCSTPISAAESCSITLLFSPYETGPRSATLEIDSNAANGVQFVPLTGTGANRGFGSISPDSLTFPRQEIGTTSGNRVVTVTNTGELPLTVLSVAIDEESASDFFISSNTCTTAISAGSACTIAIRFNPIAQGLREATLYIAADDGRDGAERIALTGTGIAPASALVSPSDLTYPSRAIGSISGNKTVTVTNSGGLPLSVTSATITGANASDFVIAKNTCTKAVGQGKTCRIGIQFNPTASGARTATLEIDSNASNGMQSASLNGIGADPAFASISSDNLTYPSREIGTLSGSRNVTVTNTGGAPLTITSVTIAGANTSDFVIFKNTCTKAINAGGACVIGMQFNPSDAGARAATLEIDSNASNGMQSVALNGTGLNPASASITPASLVYAAREIGTTSGAQLVTVTNAGGAPLTISSVTISGESASDYLVSKNTCTKAIGAGNTCVIGIKFNPTTVGTRTATLEIASSDHNGSQFIGLTGSGADPAFASISSNSLSFPNRAIGTVSGIRTVTVTNTGEAPLTIASVLLGGTNASDFIVAKNTCTKAIGAGNTCTIGIQFNPTAAGTRTATVAIDSNANNGVQSFTVTGVGTAQ